MVNFPSHDLEKSELIIVLNGLFQSHCLVARKESRGLFTPTLSEIELALEESRDVRYKSENTFYGFTTGAVELFKELSVLYENED